MALKIRKIAEAVMELHCFKVVAAQHVEKG